MAINPTSQLPGGPSSVNEEFFDALVRHQIGLLRLSGGVSKRVQALLDAGEQDMADKITARLANHKGGLDVPADVRRMQTLLKSLRATRLKSWKQIDEVWVQELRDIARAEPEFVDGALKTSVPVTLQTTLPSTGLLDKLVNSRPFEGKTLRSWASGIKNADIERIENQVKIGMLQGESSAAIARRVVGTARFKGADGVTEITRRQAAAITRTAVIAISNFSKREFYKENSDIFSMELYTATLDGRTTPICQSLDGKTFPIGEGPIPPVHFNCRSVRVAVIDGEAIGQRPARPFTERTLLDEYTKKEGLKSVAKRSSLPRGTKGGFDEFKQRRIKELTGRVPAKVTYQEWLQRQSPEFQDSVLGKSRGKLFRNSCNSPCLPGLKLDKFVGKNGDQLTLKQLKATEAAKFESAHVNVGRAAPDTGPKVALDTTGLDRSSASGLASARSMEENYLKWIKGWSPPFQDKSISRAVSNYTSSSYRRYNGFLRGKKISLDADELETLRRIDIGTTTHKLPSRTLTYRGITKLSTVIPKRALKVGTRFTDPAYTSVAADPAKSILFSREALFEIDLPKGQNAFAVDVLRSGVSETELLLPKGMSFEITEIVENSGRVNLSGEPLKLIRLKVVE